MSLHRALTLIVVVLMATATCAPAAPAADPPGAGGANPPAAGAPAGDGEFRQKFDVDKKNLSSTGRNRYFVLEPGYVLHLARGKKTLDITVTDQTKLVDGLETRVVEEREADDGALTEISRNYFAIDRTTSAVYYFGEDVDEYKDGKVSGHGGSWLAGANGARFGLMIPGDPKVGERYYQERAPKVAMDRAEVTAVDGKAEVPAGKYENCLVTRESSAIENDNGTKTYAPGVGLVADGEHDLVKVDDPAKKK